jgi:inner membrane protein
MDNLTHTLFAATLARTPLDRAGRGTTAALVLASNAPDIDIVTSAGGALSYLQWHRGPTHGPLGVAALGLVVAAMVWTGSRLLDRLRGNETDGRDGARFGPLALVSMLGVLLHILMDVPTSYGTRLLSPFDWHWFAIDLVPIIDIYLLTVLAACLWFGRDVPVVETRRSASREGGSGSP